MKITKRQLRRIIKEEKAKLLKEESALLNPAHELKDIIAAMFEHIQGLFDNADSPVDINIAAEELNAYVHDLHDWAQREYDDYRNLSDPDSPAHQDNHPLNT